MNILITGGTGFIGRALCASLLSDGHRLTVLSRQAPERVQATCGAVQPIRTLSELERSEPLDAVIHLAGEPIAAARWTEARKAQLRSSRVDLTWRLVEWLADRESKPAVLLSGSAVGYYGNQGDTPLTETSPPKTGDFAHALCAEWEEAASQATRLGIRVCLLRTGLVVGRDGGFLSKMLPLFKLGLGGRLGDGRQWMSWIHLDDHIAIQKRLLESRHLSGAFNLTAPHPVTNAEFTRTLAQCLKKPAWLPTPAPLLKLALGEMSGLLLGGQRVLPERITQDGYTFRFETLQAALQDVV